MRNIEIILDVVSLGHDLVDVRGRDITVVIRPEKIQKILLGAVRAGNEADKFSRKIAIAADIRQEIDNSWHNLLHWFLGPRPVLKSHIALQHQSGTSGHF